MISGAVRYHPALDPLLTGIEQVRPHPDNPSSGDEDAVEESIAINGMYRPIYVQRSTGYVLAGNTTYAVCLALGAECIPVVWLDVDDDTALRILLGDNQIARLALVDQALLQPQLERLLATELKLLGTGFPPPLPEVNVDLPEPPLVTGRTITVWLSGENLESFEEVDAETDKDRLFWLLDFWADHR